MDDKPETISYKCWWSDGNGLMINTSALSINHPMHPYNQIVEQGYRPEDYGMSHPENEQYDGMSRNELILEILYQKECINSMIMAEYHGFQHKDGHITKEHWLAKRRELNDQEKRF